MAGILGQFQQQVVVPRIRMDLSAVQELAGLQAYYDTLVPSSITYTAATGATSIVADLSGNSAVNVLNFNGTAGCTVANIPAFGTGDFSVGMWVQPSSIPTTVVLIGGNTQGFNLFLLIDGTLRSNKRDVGDNTASTGTLTAGTAYFVAYTRTGTTGTYYINGAAAGTTTDSFDYTGTVGFIGRLNSGTNCIFGNLSNVIIYSRVLSAGEVSALYTAGPYGTKPATNQQLIPTVPLTRGATTITDTSGNSATITLPASGVWISGARDLAQVTGANQPIYLPWSGTNYGWLPGVSGNYFSAPNTAGVVSTDLDIRAKCSLVDWTPAAGNIICAKRSGAGQVSYSFAVAAGGQFNLVTSADGTATVSANSTANNAITDGAISWIRVTRASATGKVNFYTSTDGASWTLLGNPDVATTAGGIFNSTSPVEIGTQLGGTNSPMNGAMYYADVRSNILNDGTGIVAKFSPAETTDGSSSWTASTGEVWTTNTSGGKPAMIVGKPALLFDGSAFYLKTAPFTLNQPTWVVLVGKQLTWTSGDYILDGNATDSGAFLDTTGTPKISMKAGTAVAETTAWVLNTSGVVTGVFNGATSTLQVNNGAQTTGNAGAANMGGFTLGAIGAGTSAWSNILVNAVAIFSVAPTAADIQKLVTYFAKRWGISV